MGIKSLAALTLAVPVLAGAALAPGVALAAEDGPSPWTPYEEQDFVVPAGRVCEFELQGEIVADKERYRTTATFPDGSPRYQEFTGQLVIRFVNGSTGASVQRNLTGRGDFEYFADGSWTLTDIGGHIGVGLRSGDDPAPGYYIVTGSGFALHQDATGHRTLTNGSGEVENICTTLS